MNEPVDLKRERALRSLDSRMSRAISNIDQIRARRYLRGPRMPDKPSSIRLPPQMHKRLAAVAKKMGKDPEMSALTGSKVSASQAHRMALQLGLEVLEERYGIRKK